MQSKSARGVPSNGSLEKSTFAKSPDWEGTRVFLEIVRHGSFRAASFAQNLSLNALRRRFEEFEQRCGVTLATRGSFGIQLTAEGQKIYEAAQKMEAAYFDVLRARDQTSNKMEGRIRFAVTEGLGAFWLAPRLVEFQRAHPKLTIEMHCAMSPPDILRLEADVAVQLSRPDNKDLMAVRLGRVHAMPFASPSYLETYGKPATIKDFAVHRMVLQMAPNIPSETVLRNLFPDAPVETMVAFQSNVSSTHYWSIAKGAGIGFLPTYATAMGAPVVAIDIRDEKNPARMLRSHSDIWLTCHPDAYRIARVRKLVAWLREAFSAKLYPWFADDFVHPDEFPHSFGELPAMNFFAGFSSEATAIRALEERVS